MATREREHLEDVMKQFLYTQGYTKPDRWYSRIEGAEHGNLCFFCENPHMDHKLIYLDNEKEGVTSSHKVRTGQYPIVGICNSCSPLYEDIEDSGGYKEEIESVADRGREAMANQLASVEERIEKYSSTGLLQGSRVRVYGVKKSQCYFCEVRGDNHYDIPVPVGTSKSIVNTVKCCFVCKDKINRRVSSLNARGITTRTGVTQDQCFTCANVYAITILEFRARELGNSLGKHYCGDCMSEVQGIPRFLKATCKTCNSTHTQSNLKNLRLDVTDSEYTDLLFKSRNPLKQFNFILEVEKLCVLSGIGSCRTLKEFKLEEKEENDMATHVDLGKGYKAKIDYTECGHTEGNHKGFSFKIYNMNERFNEDSSKKKLSEILLSKISFNPDKCDGTCSSCNQLFDNGYIAAFKAAEVLYTYLNDSNNA